MPRVTIDNQAVEVPEGATILDAAKQLGIEIPTLCHLDGCRPNASCMVCVVRINGRADLSPSCATPVVDGMVIESETEAVHEARRTALELLLSDHSGDCLAPCVNGCPAHMDISSMNRLIAADDLRGAIEVVKADIPLPATLGRICPAPCEPSCRRAAVGGSVAICKLKQYVADQDLEADAAYVPTCEPHCGKSVAVVGAGPSGLSAAYFLLRAGVDVDVFDRNTLPGGALRYEIPPERLPRDVLNGEIDVIRRMGARFHADEALGAEISLEQLQLAYDAVVIATGGVDTDLLGHMGLETTRQGLRINPESFGTNLEGVFAAGGAVRPSKLAIRSIAEGKAVAGCVVQYLEGKDIQRPDEVGFNVRLGKLTAEQLTGWFESASREARHEPENPVQGLDAEAAREEAMRCLHCECGAQEDCRLREQAAKYQANPKRFSGGIGRPVSLRVEHPFVLYEPGKCIACGLCVQIAERDREALGLTFVGRGFNVHIDAPSGARLDEALRVKAQECAEACPTGALSLRAGVAVSEPR